MPSPRVHAPVTVRRGKTATPRFRLVASLAAILVSTAVGAGGASQAEAVSATGVAYSPVDFSSQADFTWLATQTDPIGATATYFPGGPVGSVTLGGIPFNIRSNAAGFEAWNGWVAAGGPGSTDGTVTLTIPVNVYGATSVYSLINTYWGSASASYTALVFTGSGGATYTDEMFEGSDIRGWCCVGSINGTSTTNVFSEASSPINGAPGVLDMQHIVLPAVFATQTLTSIQVVDSGASGVQRTILDGLTVQSGGTLVTNRQAMDGDLKVAQGSTMSVGYDFTIPHQHGATNVGFTGASVEFNVTCTAGTPSSPSLTVAIPDQTYVDPAGSSAWYPSGDQTSALTFQGLATVPTCSDPSGLVRFQQGGIFSTDVVSDVSGVVVNIRWHYKDGSSGSGGWSGTYGFTTT